MMGGRGRQVEGVFSGEQADADEGQAVEGQGPGAGEAPGHLRLVLV